MRSICCPLCDTNAFDILRVTPWTVWVGKQAERWTTINVICRHCGFVFQNPQPDEVELERFYEVQHRECGSDAVNYDLEREAYYDAVVRYLVDQVGDGKRMLDVGCYQGAILRRFSEAGWVVAGMEPSSEGVEACRKQGLNVVHGSFADFRSSEHYDLIVMNGVLEHVADPNRFLARAGSLLRDEGFLYLSVPNVQAPFLNSVSEIFTHQHLTNFSPATLRAFLEKHGFTVMDILPDFRWSWCIRGLAQHRKGIQTGGMEPPGCSEYRKTLSIVKQYSGFLDHERTQVNDMLMHLWNPQPRRVVIYAAGSHTEMLLRHTGLRNADIVGLVDGSPSKWGNELEGYSIHSPEKIEAMKPECVVISSRAFQEDIWRRLQPLEAKGIEVLRLYENETHEKG